MNAPTPIAPTPGACPYCGAFKASTARVCWLCDARFDDPDHPLPAEVAASVAHRAKSISFSLSTLLIFFTIAAVVSALIAAAPGLGIPIAVILTPVLVRTALVVRRRAQRGVYVPWPKRIALATTSAIVTTIMVGIVFAATFAAFCVGIAAGARQGLSWPAFLAAGIGGLSAAALMGYIARERYLEDIEEH